MIAARPEQANGTMASPASSLLLSTPLKITATPNKNRKRAPLGECRLETPVSAVSRPRCRDLRSSARKSRRLVDAPEIREQVELLFGAQVLALPCVSARLVACYSLQSAIFLPSQGSLWKLCDALVRVEATSLHVTSTPSPAYQRKISFCGFDCSSSLPPVDRIDGSEEHQQLLIEALVEVKRAVLEMETGGVSELNSLQHLLDFLGDRENCLHWQQECARSIHDSYPTQRVQSAWKQYISDLQALFTRTSTMKTTRQVTYPTLSVEQRLAHFIGQAIRRELRNLINPPPPRYCSKDSTYEQRALTYSQAYAYIKFSGPQGAAAGDKNLASLVSTALRRLYDYFGLQVLLQANPVAMMNIIPKEFCAKAKLLDAISVDHDCQTTEFPLVECVLHDMDQACLFLAATNAARFLVELFNVPKVQSEVERRGGWSQLETYAALSWQYQLHDIVDEDAHLVILANVSTFFSTLRSCHDSLIMRAKDCQRSLNNLCKQQRINTKSQCLLRKSQHIRLLQERYEFGKEQYLTFPRVASIKVGNLQK